VKQAYACRKWAFVSDYVRLKVLYEYGGIYFDTDVEVVKSFDELLKYKAFIGYESAYSVCTAVIGAEKKSTFVKKILDEYINKDFTTPNGKLNTQPNSKLCFNLIKKFYQNPNVKEVQFFNDVTIFPSDYFSPINCYNMKKTITGNTYSVHYYKSSWKNSQQRFKDRVLALITRLIGEEVREKVKYWIRRI
jgi:mannosyltransferase OCH1-like enzyme